MDYVDTRLHFIGCGGVGMAGLAAIALERGARVSGSDLKDSPGLERLRAAGAVIHLGHGERFLPRVDTSHAPPPIIVYSSAIPKDNPELARARAEGWECHRRGEFLAMIAGEYRRAVAVAGSHGMTTVTSMIVHIVRECGAVPGFMIGGLPTGWSASAAAGDGDIFVTEADESDLTFELIKAAVAVVTNVEDDHAWSVGGEKPLFEAFVRFGRKAGTLIYGQDPATSALFDGISSGKPLDAVNASARFAGQASWGPFQRQNASLAAAAAVELGFPPGQVDRAVRSFKGVERRMSVRGEGPGFRVIEDYAHHPTELKAALAALREMHPGMRLRMVFQPHRYARLERYFASYVEILKTVDRSVVLPVFAAWVEKGLLDSKALAEAIGPTAEYLEGEWAHIAARLLADVKKPEVLAIIGAGDTDELVKQVVKRMPNPAPTKLV